MPDTTSFDTAYQKLNTAQKQAVDTIDGPVFVLAGPGTGKTQILTLRIANILRMTDTPPEAILALTFTESATMHMRERLTKLIGSRATRVRIHTFHGFAQLLVEHHPDHFPRIIGSHIATDIERAEIMDDVLLHASVKYLKPFGDPMYYHKLSLGAISTMKREGVTVDVLAERVKQAEDDFEALPDTTHKKGVYAGKLKGKYEKLKKQIAKTRDLLTVYTAYEARLFKQKRYDFDDLMLEAVRALSEGSAFLREVQESIFYVLADEHQDANIAQNSLLELLINYQENPNLFIVGDEKQAIYRFQGANLDTMHHFRELFKGTQIIPLSENYRSTQTILDVALSLISASSDTHLSHVPLRSQVKHDTDEHLTVIEAATPNDEGAYIANDIKQHLLAGVQSEDIAVLLRRNKDVTAFATLLRKHGVPVIGTEQNIFENRFVKALVRFLTVINEPADTQFAGILALPNFHLSISDIWRITSTARRLRIPIISLLASPRELSTALVHDGDTVQRLYKLIDHLAHKASIERPAVIASEAMKAPGILDSALQAPDSEESIGALRACLDMFDDLSEREHDALLPRALSQIALACDKGISQKSRFIESFNRVKVMTIHRSKGREFSLVYVPRFTDNKWGGRAHANHFHLPGVLTTESEIEDERRLFYVAITRAKKHCTISYARSKEDGSSTNPASFISDIDASYITYITPLSAPEFPLRQMNINSKKNLPTDDERATLVSAFLSQGLTPTALNNYLDCPWHYFYVNLLRIPESENKFMLFGTAIHATLKYYADKRTSGEDIPPKKLIVFISGLLANAPLTTEQLKELMEKGEQALSSWWEERHSSWPNKIETEKPIEVTIKTSSGDIPVHGKLDRIDYTDDGIMVVDYKTGKPKTRNTILGKTKNADKNYLRQLIFYKLLLAKASEPVDMRYGIIDFIQPDEKGKIHKEVFDITDEYVTELLETIERVAHEIQILSFWNATCDKADCVWCSLRNSL